ncbi:hypothetical protein O0L34_g8243 [Tuta absoluta]|nr:hypothetical protein O0L34_g8243 [Tuta absoluta]
MRPLSAFLVLAVVTAIGLCSDSLQANSYPGDVRLSLGEKRLSEQLLLMLKHFKQKDPVGLPVAEIQDPTPLPVINQSLSFATVKLINTLLYGVSKFRIVYVQVDIGAMEVRAFLVMDKLQARGNYTMSTWLNRAQGPYTVDISGLKVKARANLGVDRNGKLKAEGMNMDLGFSTINVNFQNLGLLGSMFQGVVNTMGSVLFDSVKPFVLANTYDKMRTAIDNELAKVAGDMQFPNSISPLDMVIADLRKKVRGMGLDPYQIKDYNTTASIFVVSLSRTWVFGLSSFQRVGNITLKMENNTLIADFEIGTQKLEGVTGWDISAVGGLMSRAGTASFSAEYISGRFIVAQPLDTREKPQFRDVQLELGNIQVRCDGAGTVDYVIEFIVNVLPNLLRYQIMDACEKPLRERIQEELNKVDVEEVIMSKLPELDKLQETGFKLSSLKEGDVRDETYDDDEFFDF